MKKHRQLVSILLVVVMLLGTFAACTQNSAPGGDTAPPAQGGTDGGDAPAMTGGGSLANTPGGQVLVGEFIPYVGALFALPYFIDHRVGLERAGIVFAKSLSFGARQKFGIGIFSIISRPPYLYDIRPPRILEKIAEKCSP